MLRLSIAFLATFFLCDLNVRAEQAARPDGPLAQAISRAAEQSVMPPYRVKRYALLEGEENFEQVELYEPLTTEDGTGKWTLLSFNGRAPNEQELADYGAEERQDDSFEIYPNVVGTMEIENALLIEEDEEKAIYRLKETKAAFLNENGNDLAKHLETRITVVKAHPYPYVSHLEIYAPEPFRKALVAKIKTFKVAISYAPHETTHVVLPRSFDMTMDVNMFFVSSTRSRAHMTFMDYEAL